LPPLYLGLFYTDRGRLPAAQGIPVGLIDTQEEDVLYASCEKPFDLLCYRIHRKCLKVNEFCTFGMKDVALNGTKHILHDYSPEVDEYLTIHCYQPEPGYCACVLQAADP